MKLLKFGGKVQKARKTTTEMNQVWLNFDRWASTGKNDISIQFFLNIYSEQNFKGFVFVILIKEI